MNATDALTQARHIAHSEITDTTPYDALALLMSLDADDRGLVEDYLAEHGITAAQFDFRGVDYRPSHEGRVDVILDPSTRKLYTYDSSSTPGSVWHRRHRVVITVGASACPVALRGELEKYAARLEEIVAAWQGEEFDGSNWVGRWSQDDWDLSLCGDDGAGFEVALPHLWDAADWYVNGVGDIIDEILVDGVEAVAQREVEAADSEVILDLEDVTRYLRERVEARLDELVEQLRDCDLEPSQIEEIEARLRQMWGTGDRAGISLLVSAIETDDWAEVLEGA